MSTKPVLAVARWEYHRFAKPRDLIMSIVSFVVIFGIFGIVGKLVDRKSSETKTVAVLGGEFMGLKDVEAFDRFELLAEERDRDALETALLDEEFNALLVITGPDEAKLIIRGERQWQQEFLALLVGHIQSRRLIEGGLDPELLAALTAMPNVQRLELERPAGTAGRAETKTTLIVVGIMLMGLFVGFSYVFVAITGEKTQRVTESVLSAITPQQWVDGKILGLTAVVVLNLLCYGIGYLLYKLAAVFIFNEAFSLPSGIGDATTVAWLILYSWLGFGFWFTFLAMLAATINDPNSSSRSSFIMLPFLPMGLSMIGIDQPDVLWMRILSLVPGISPAAMPVRLMRGDPAIVEVVLSLVLLAITVWMFRRTAGRIFGTTMLMTGKEPSLAEVWRWARKA